MILLEQLLREQRDKAERRKLREAEEVICCTILRVGGAKVVEVTFNQRRLHLVVTDEYDCTLVIFDADKNEIDGDDRREILLGLSKEVE